MGREEEGGGGVVSIIVSSLWYVAVNVPSYDYVSS